MGSHTPRFREGACLFWNWAHLCRGERAGYSSVAEERRAPFTACINWGNRARNAALAARVAAHAHFFSLRQSPKQNPLSWIATKKTDQHARILRAHTHKVRQKLEPLPAVG